MGAQAAGGRRHRNVQVAARRTGDRVVTAIASALAVLVAAAGVIVLAAHLSEPASSHGGHGLAAGAAADAHTQHSALVYEVGGVQLAIQDVAWMSHDMFGGPAPAENNFPMPAQMMPGMQSDDVNRLHVELTVTNRKDTLAPFRRSNFAVESPQGKRWGANPGDPQNADVPAGASMSIDLYFDVPLQERVANILFANGGGLVRIPFQGGEPQHKHG